MSDLLHQRLTVLHEQTQPDSDFADQLEKELRGAYEQTPQPVGLNLKVTRRTRLYRRLAVVAASLLIVVGLFITVPPLRSFAQDIMNYFVPGVYTQPSEEDMAIASSGSRPVETVADAEAIAGFHVREWPEEGYQIAAINASKTLVGMLYESVPATRPSRIVSLEQSIAGVYGDTEPVGDGAHVETVTVNGVEGEYVQGMWTGEVTDGIAGPTVWNHDTYRQLRWQEGNIIYRVSISTEIADTPAEVVALAESLK
jgi:hypothetical protein